MNRKNYELLKSQAPGHHGAHTSTTDDLIYRAVFDAFICRAVFDLVMDISSAPTYVEKKLCKKGSGEEVGIAFVRIEEAKSGMEGLVWAEDALQEGGFDMKLTSSNAMRRSSLVVTERSKGPGKSGGKRHQKVLRDDIQGITKPKPDIKRLARKGGVLRTRGLNYEGNEGIGSESGSLLTKGARFSSISDFLSFMSDDKTSHHAIEDREIGDSKLLMHPVVKLAKLSPKEEQFVVGKGVISGGGNDKKAVQRARKGNKEKSLDSKSEDFVDRYSSSKSHGKYQCRLCEALFGFRRDMRRHLEGPHGFGEGWDCKNCGKQFKNKHSKYKHLSKICGQ